MRMEAGSILAGLVPVGHGGGSALAGIRGCSAYRGHSGDLDSAALDSQEKEEFGPSGAHTAASARAPDRIPAPTSPSSAGAPGR